jgi:hypothetical protein
VREKEREDATSRNAPKNYVSRASGKRKQRQHANAPHNCNLSCAKNEKEMMLRADNGAQLNSSYIILKQETTNTLRRGREGYGNTPNPSKNKSSKNGIFSKQEIAMKYLLKKDDQH